MPCNPSARAWTAALLISLSALHAFAHRHWVDKPFRDQRLAMHRAFLAGEAPSPIQYRVLAPLALEAFGGAGLPPDAAEWLLRFAATAASALLLLSLLRRWFGEAESLTGVLLMFASLPLAYQRYYWQPADMPNLAFTVWALALIADRRDGALAGVLAAAALNRETPVLIPLAWLLTRFDEFPPGEALKRFLGLCAAPLSVYAGLRLAYGPRPYYSRGLALAFNATEPLAYLNFALLLGVLAALAFAGLGAKPKTMRRWVLFAPFFAAFHFIAGVFAEGRLHLPLFPVLIPAALATLFPPRPETEPPAKAPPWLLRRAGLLYGWGLAAFCALATAYALSL